MKTQVYIKTLAITVAAFITGCVSNNAAYQHQSKTVPLQQNARSAPPPVAQKTQPLAPPPPAPLPAYSGSIYHYSAPMLTGTYANYSSVRNFIDSMARKHGFSESYLNGLFSQANRLESVIRLESPPPYHGPSRPGSWTRYRNKFLTDAHINHGVDFWRENAPAIEKASAFYGVDPEYIVAIIGVETYFGRNVGRTRTFDALTTLAFDTHRRSEFFTSELENYLLMTREEGLDPLEPVGSWAGAMGLGQFMPSSFRRLAVDFNKDGRRDLWQAQDAIGSVANYFSHSGWQFKSPVATPAGRSSNSSVIELSTYNGDEYWRIYPNFKVIKKYNNSNKYAMAVHQLAQAIKHRVISSGPVVRTSSSR